MFHENAVFCDDDDDENNIHYDDWNDNNDDGDEKNHDDDAEWMIILTVGNFYLGRGKLDTLTARSGLIGTALRLLLFVVIVIVIGWNYHCVYHLQSYHNMFDSQVRLNSYLLLLFLTLDQDQGELDASQVLC